MKFKRLGCLFFAAVLVSAVFLISGCTAATEASKIEISDASGKGSIMSDVIIRTDADSANAPYVKDVKKIAEHLNEKVDSLTETSGIYKVSYEGQNEEGAHIIRMTYSFDDINDYNRKTMRLYNCMPRSSRNSISGLPETYEEIMPTWQLTDNGDGTYTATFSQSGYAFTVMNLWAYQYLIKNDIEDAWDNTGDGQAAQYSPFTDQITSSIVRSVDSKITVTLGDTTEQIDLYSGGSNAQTVSVTGKVSGTPTQLDKSVNDDGITVKTESKEPSSTVSSASSAASASDETPENGGINPWMISTCIVAAVTIIAIVAVAVTANKKGGKQ